MSKDEAQAAASHIQRRFREQRVDRLLVRAEAAAREADAQRVQKEAEALDELKQRIPVQQAVAPKWWKRTKVCDWISPTVVAAGNGGTRCAWREVGVRRSNAPERGFGLFAVEDIRAFSRLDYYGVKLKGKELQSSDYCLRRVARGPRSREVIDAHPRWYNDWQPSLRAHLPAALGSGSKRRQLEKLPTDLMICGLINEPLERLGEAPNMKLFAMPWGTAYAVAVRDIRAGEELLTLYGPQYHRPTWDPPYSWLHSTIYIRFAQFQPSLCSWYRIKGRSKGSASTPTTTTVAVEGLRRGRERDP